MTRHRRKTTLPAKYSSLTLLDELLEPTAKPENRFGTKELKLEINQLKLEQKLNKHIGRFIDFQLQQLEKTTNTKPDLNKDSR